MLIFFLALWIKIRYNTEVLEKSSPLAEAAKSLRAATMAQEARGIHALILAVLAKLFTRLETLITLWQEGQLPTTQEKVASNKNHRETARRGETRKPSSPRTAPSPRLPVHLTHATQASGLTTAHPAPSALLCRFAKPSSAPPPHNRARTQPPRHARAPPPPHPPIRCETRQARPNSHAFIVPLS
jgi:hypothetical protein